LARVDPCELTDSNPAHLHGDLMALDLAAASCAAGEESGDGGEDCGEGALRCCHASTVYTQHAPCLVLRYIQPYIP